MEPLSLAANVIAVAQAASRATTALRKLYNLRSAPDELFQFQNEISDLRVIVAILNETIGVVPYVGSFDRQIEEHLGCLIQRATDSLLSFNSIIHHEMVIEDDVTRRNGIKFSWRSWLKYQSRLRKLSAELRSTRTEIHLALATMTVCEAPRIRLRLDELSTQKQELGESLRQFESSSIQQITSLSNSLGFIQTSLDSSRKTLQGIQAAVKSPNTTSKSPILLQTSLTSPGCDSPLCSCRCHNVTTRKLPRWLHQVVGFLLIGYSGIPYSRPCNERNCRREDKSLLTVTYYFPWWFWNRCVISFRDRWDPVEGHVISVRTPRLVSEIAPVLLFAKQGNIKGLQDLFTQGLASPFDVGSESGASVLHYAATEYRIETFEFLINQYADPYLENQESMSPIDLLWNYFLTEDNSRRSLEGLQASNYVSKRLIDPRENLKNRRFTTIHKIVLRLSSINLKAQLETCPGDIDSLCAMRRTPLHWAASGGKDEYVQTLLDFGASIHIQDSRGQNPIHRAVTLTTSGPQLLEKLLVAGISRQATFNTSPQSPLANGFSSSSINFAINPTLTTASLKLALDQRDHWDNTPLIIACTLPSRWPHVKLLLKYSADINARSSMDGTALHMAIQYNCHASIDLLFKAQARVDLKDGEGMGILHSAGICSNLETLNILERYVKQIRETGGLEDRDIYGHTPLEAFDIQRPSYVVEDDEMRLKCRRVFLSLLGLDSEEPRDTPQDIYIQGIEDGGTSSEISDDDASDIFLDVEQDPEGPI